MYQINQTHGLLKKINSVIQKITEPIQPKVAEHKPQTVKRLSYPFSREKQHLWVNAFCKCSCQQVPAFLTAAKAPKGERKNERQHFVSDYWKEYFLFFFFPSSHCWGMRLCRAPLWNLCAAVVIDNTYLCNYAHQLLDCQTRFIMWFTIVSFPCKIICSVKFVARRVGW